MNCFVIYSYKNSHEKVDSTDSQKCAIAPRSVVNFIFETEPYKLEYVELFAGPLFFYKGLNDAHFTSRYLRKQCIKNTSVL